MRNMAVCCVRTPTGRSRTYTPAATCMQTDVDLGEQAVFLVTWYAVIRHESAAITAATHPREEHASSQEQELVQLAARLAAHDLRIGMTKVLLHNTGKRNSTASAGGHAKRERKGSTSTPNDCTLPRRPLHQKEVELLTCPGKQRGETFPEDLTIMANAVTLSGSPPTTPADV